MISSTVTNTCDFWQSYEPQRILLLLLLALLQASTITPYYYIDTFFGQGRISRRIRVYGLYGAAHVSPDFRTKKGRSELFSGGLAPQRENQAKCPSHVI